MGGNLRQERDGDHTGEDLGPGVLRAAGPRLCPDADASLQPREKGRMRFHKLQNVQIALDYLRHRQVRPLPDPTGPPLPQPPYGHH